MKFAWSAAVEKKLFLPKAMKHSILDYFRSHSDQKNIQDTGPRTYTMESTIVAFTDGSYKKTRSNEIQCGYAVVFPEHQDFNVSQRLRQGHVSNNRAEYMAFIEAIEQSDKIDPSCNRLVIVYSDSELLVKTVNEWSSAWKSRGWKRFDGSSVKNLDLVQRIDALMHSHRKIVIRHIRAHTNKQDYYSVWNEKADEQAKLAARM